MIELAEVGKNYGAVSVIENISLSIRKGEFVVLVGPSGSGKSTLLRMIAGLEAITSGECRISGRRVNELPAKDRGLAMVFQNYALYPHMTVYENLAFALKVQGKSRQQIDARVREVAAIVQLESYLKRNPAQLSGGQRQRVAMARAMVRETELFLFDEPLSNLDAKLRGQMRVEIRKLHETLGATSVYVTHDQTEAMTLADRIVVLDKGRVEQVGTPHELYENPQTRFVAGFLGAPAMNFIESGVAGQEAGQVLAIRPEHLVQQPLREDDLRLDTTVDLVEYLGSSLICHCRMQDQTLIAQLTPEAGKSLVKGQAQTLYAARDRVIGFRGNQRVPTRLCA